MAWSTSAAATVDDVTFQVVDDVEEGLDVRRELGAGETLGRYVVLARVGAGAMGVVYAAFDPQLDRKVALKIIHPDRAGCLATGQQRLLREAQSLARLSHPNVVSVHDVGTHDDQVYVAMEFVEGETLGTWWRRAGPSQTEILRVFRAAGEGLAAAHRVGLVHRDFKPDNVILAHDGTVRVLDFGLARPEEAEESISRAPLMREVGRAMAPSTVVAGLTRTGGVLGTPVYMAPEQHLGLPATARSDQFSFCVALYEALYGERPFPEDTLEALALAVVEGQFREPSQAKVPGWIRRVLLTGLASRASDRYPDMECLLRALAHDPAVRHRKALTGGGMITLGGVAVWGLLAGAAAPAPCENAGAPLAAVWSPEARETMKRGFEATGLPFAAASFEAAAERLDRWAREWEAGRQDACEASQVRKEQSSDLMDRRIVCFDRALGEAAALVERLTAPTADAIERAPGAVEALPSPADCGDVEALLAGRPPLRGKDRERADAIEDRIARARAAMGTGDYTAADALMDGVSEQAEALRDPLTRARVSRTLADLAWDRGDGERSAQHLQQTVLMADAAGDDRLRARAATSIVRRLGHARTPLGDAPAWERYANGVLGRLGNPDLLEGELSLATGSFKLEAGEYDEAIVDLKAGLARLEAAPGNDPGGLASGRLRLATAYWKKGQFSQALALQREILERRRKDLGPDHPRVASTHASVALTLLKQGDLEGADHNFRQALDILARTFGEDNDRYLRQLGNSGAVAWELGDMEEVEQIQRRILAHHEARHGAEDLRLAPPLTNLGNVLDVQGRREEARDALERALAIRRKVLDPEHPAIANAEDNLGIVLFGLGEYDEALSLYEHAASIWTKKLGPYHPQLGSVEMGRGDVALARKQPRRAIQHFQRAVELLESGSGGDHTQVGRCLTNMGIAYLAVGDHEAARVPLARAYAMRKDPRLTEKDRAKMAWAYVRALQGEDLDLARTVAAGGLEDARAGPDSELLAALEGWILRHR